MAYIYKIENDINQKIYIGKTTRSLEERFAEHCRMSKLEGKEKRPLYAAMRKYGIEHFHISLIEETYEPEERERYWIEYFSSFKNGYNATQGGDGKSYLDYDLIINTYKKCGSQEKTAELCGCCRDSVARIVKTYHIIPEYRYKGTNSAAMARSKTVIVETKEGQEIKTFSSLSEAGRWVQIAQNKTSSELHGIKGNIRKCCQNKRKSAYGYCWKFL